MGETKGYRGVGFYIKKRMWKYVYEIRGVNERICLAKLELENKVKMVIIQVYAPILDAEDEEKTQFYESLCNVINEEREYYTVVMGDFNGKVGKGRRNTSAQTIIGRYAASDTTNDNGKRMLELASACNLKVAGTYFKKKYSRKWTWSSPDKRTKNEIDHMLTNDMAIIKDVVPLNRVEVSSDHRLVRSRIVIERRARYYLSLIHISEPTRPY